MRSNLKQNRNLFDWKQRNSLISVGGMHKREMKEKDKNKNQMSKEKEINLHGLRSCDMWISLCEPNSAIGNVVVCD